jgi:ABC-type oligopeptide transport system substrate-binding subunit
MGHITPGFFKSPIPGTTVRNPYWSPPGGVQVPTPNYAHINNPQLSALMDKQLGQFSLDERKATFREIGDLLAEQLYLVPFSTYSETYFGDPSVKNAQVPWWSYGGPLGWVKYWWKE